jgi:hypothetical protein
LRNGKIFLSVFASSEDIQIFPCQPVVGRAAAGLSDTAALHFRLWLRHAALRRVNPRLTSLRPLGSGLNLRGISAVEPDALNGIASRQQEKAALRTEFNPLAQLGEPGVCPMIAPFSFIIRRLHQC